VILRLDPKVNKAAGGPFGESLGCVDSPPQPKSLSERLGSESLRKWTREKLNWEPWGIFFSHAG